MNAVLTKSDHAYGNVCLRSARDIEYDMFSRITRMLRLAPRNCDCCETIAAVGKNNELWSLLATDLADPGNGLPDEIRAGLLALAFFSLRHGRTVLAGAATTDVLIDINMTVMKGLRGGEME
ncbi:flagellar biosynthesis regulator FlaF [Paracoccus sp. MBLB3053]|uniref:Flagellar biosynthesis regulator FlaF n=1 Tax=Paracoccus aurantius TaxID=3073814 RepID=A0ABU2HM12_9RHOB|nr:flagellar biosynthesis regulator FlaF [Paracoccus sp. MBLB3053]MDS9466068.1 flagellar biosynthesis regulator FlaF [Paracoccus sp. MBLB3053]